MAAFADAQPPAAADNGKAAAPAEPAPAVADTTDFLWQDPLASQRFLPWLGVRYDTSPQVTEQHVGYSSFEAFVPVVQGDNALLFFNGKSFVDNDDRWGSNVGLGGRWHNASTDRVLGGNVYWDNLDSGTHSFNQIGLGIESLGRYLDFRANGYIPVGRTEPVNAVTYADPTFFNHFILLNQNTFFDAAMSGFDSEVGGWVPYLGGYGLRAYAGIYEYQASNTRSTTGGHLRLEERVTDNLDLNLTVNSDRVFGTTVSFAVGFRFGGPSRREGARNDDVQARMADRVQRNDNIVVEDPETTTPVLATKPGTNTPIFVDHFASYAPAGGNGTFEHPFNTLQNPTSPQPADILFVWANSVFKGQSMVLLNNQRFLGEGLIYPFTASQGSFLLPRATSNTNLPVLGSAPGNAVTLANNNEAAGFAITGAGQSGIFGNGVTGFNIHDNIVTGSGSNGIALLNIDGTGEIRSNTTSGNVGDGIRIVGARFTGDIAYNTSTGNAPNMAGVGDGIHVEVAAFTGNILGNIASNNATSTVGTGDGIRVVGTSFIGSIMSNTAIGNGTGVAGVGDGIRVAVDNYTGNIVGNTTNNNATGVSGTGDGLRVVGTSFTGNITGNTANGQATGIAGTGDGIRVTEGTYNGNIVGNRTNNNATALLSTGEGMNLTVTGSGRSIVGVSDNSFSGNTFGATGSQFVATQAGTGILGVTFDGNSTTTLGATPSPFDFRNTGAGIFQADLGINTGSTGSSIGGPTFAPLGTAFP
jgi:Inverse autotransporter, beta-domain/Right handed beta helix region